MEASSLLLVIGLALSFFMAWNLGANDAATPCDTAVGSGAVSPRVATILFSIFAAIGAVSQGYMNIKTISRGIIPRIDPLGAITITLAACLWSAFCTWKGLEISNTYTIIGSVIGYAIIVYGSFQIEVLSRILFAWVISPASSILLSFILQKLVTVLFHNFFDNERFIRITSLLLIASLCFSAYSFGVNDVGNATGAFVAVTHEVIGMPDDTTMLILAMFGALGIAIGGFTWGRRVIETVAFKIVRIDVLSGLVAEITNAIIVYFFVTIPYIFLGYGLPVSTSIIGIGAIIGTAFAKGQGIVDKRTMVRLLITWAVTLPMTAIISMTLYSITSQILAFNNVTPLLS